MRTSRFWSSRSWNNSGMAADLSCCTSADIRIDRRAGRVRIGPPRLVNLPGHGAQRGFHRRPIRLLRTRKLEAILDAGDLRIAEQRVGFLRRRLAGKLRLGRRKRHQRRRRRRRDARRLDVGGVVDAKASRSGSFTGATACGGASGAGADFGDRQFVGLVFPVRDRALRGSRRQFRPGRRQARHARECWWRPRRRPVNLSAP